MKTFTHLPAGSRVWIYQADRSFSAAESAAIDIAVTEFASQWSSHKEKVVGDGGLLYNRFVVLVADEDQLQIGGCSIDGTVRFIKELGAKYKVDFFDRFFTCYWNNDQIAGEDFNSFKAKLSQGLISNDTIVFNNLITTLEGLQTKWQVPLSQSWHSKFLSHNTSLKL